MNFYNALGGFWPLYKGQGFSVLRLWCRFFLKKHSFENFHICIEYAWRCSYLSSNSRRKPQQNYLQTIYSYSSHIFHRHIFLFHYLGNFTCRKRYNILLQRKAKWHTVPLLELAIPQHLYIGTAIPQHLYMLTATLCSSYCSSQFPPVTEKPDTPSPEEEGLQLAPNSAYC